MTIDNTELEKALLAEAPKQWTRFQARKVKMERGKPKWQQELVDVERKVEMLRRQYDPELMRIQTDYDRRLGVSSSSLSCPKCHDADHANRMNGKPWCLKCNVALESPFLVKKRLPDLKMLPKTKRLDVTFRGIDQ